MSSMNKRRMGVWLAGFAALPLVSAASPQPQSPAQNEKLQWLLTTHDIRFVMQTPRGKQDCLQSEAEQGR